MFYTETLVGQKTRWVHVSNMYPPSNSQRKVTVQRSLVVQAGVRLTERHSPEAEVPTGTRQGSNQSKQSPKPEGSPHRQK